MNNNIPQKVCCHCKQHFPATLEFFYSNKGTRDGFATRCKGCWGKDKPPKVVIPEGYKQCACCKGIFPANLEHFHVNNALRSGLNTYCKTCTHSKRVATYASQKEQGPRSPLPEKMTCIKCGMSKPATQQFFSIDPSHIYGLSSRCKLCHYARARELRYKNPQRERQRTKRDYQRRAITYFKPRYQEKREEILARQKAFLLKHPETVHEWKRRYAKTDRGHEVARAKEHRRRTHKFKGNGTYTLQEITQQRNRQHNKCYYCKCRLKKYHIEHIVPLSRGGSNNISNIVIACPTCNWKKHDKLLHEWPEGGRLL